MCWTYGQCYVFSIWVVGSNIVIGLYITGHVVSAVCYLCDWWDLI